MRSSYREDDVVLLLKDITGLVRPQPAEERERLIQSGKHYSEMLPVEYVPSDAYMRAYQEALSHYAKPVALAVGNLSDKIMAEKGAGTVLVSLARAGIPIGILIKRYIKTKYQVDLPHYSISIIRGRGIDGNAMKYLTGEYDPGQLLFVDGWTGKGAILNELRKAVANYDGVSADIAVVADPANITGLCGTHEDILIPSSCLNSTVSGLVSRTFLRDDIIGENDFHGAVFYGELADSDLSYDFIDRIEQEFELTPGQEGGAAQDLGMEPKLHPRQEDCAAKDLGKNLRQNYSHAESTAQDIATEPKLHPSQEDCAAQGIGMDEVKEIARRFGVDDINFVKPGIGETTRVLLRRVPWKILVDERYRNDPQLGHLVRLAEEKNVPIELFPMKHYKCCGIIKRLADT